MLAATQAARAEVMVARHIADAQERIRRIVAESKIDDLTVIENVRIAFPYKFLYLLGGVSAFLDRFPKAREILDRNTRDEIEQDHIGLVIAFAASAGARPTWRNEDHMAPICDSIRLSLSDPALAAKFGVALLAMLENTSEVFIPDMEARAKRCGATDLRFTQVHGVADIAHATELCEAAAEVYGECQPGDEELFVRAMNAGVAFIERIYTPLN